MTEDWSIELDLGPEAPPTEARILGNAKLLLPKGYGFALDKLVLDTGSAWHLLIPQQSVPDAMLQQAETADVRGFGGCVEGRVLRAELVIGDWHFVVDAVALPDQREWVVGFPVLRHFDLLLRSSALVGPAEPYPGAAL